MVEGSGPQIRDIQQEIDQGIGIESDGVQQVGGDQLELMDELIAESSADLSFGSLNYNGNVAEDVLGQDDVLGANRIHVANVGSLCNDLELNLGDTSK